MSSPAISDAPGDPRPLRADARRNRERVLAAARVVISEHGSEAQMDAIARRAEVGVGTLYRHFPTKEALIGALVADSFVKLAAAAHAALDEPDAWPAFEGVLWRGAELLVANRGVTEWLCTLPTVDDAPNPAQADLHADMAILMERAKAAGALRADACVDDIPMLMAGVGMATRKPHPCPDSWRRHLQIVLDGLRAPAATSPLPD